MIKTGLVGRSIMASRSPWLHEQEARHQGVALSYELFDFTETGRSDEDLGQLLRTLARDGYSGVNVTHPFKQIVMPLLDGLGDSAASVGAVNTVVIREGRLIGHNTDMSGFRGSFAHGLPGAAISDVVLLGAGGAGAAVGSALLSLGAAKLHVVDTDGARARDLCRRLQDHYGQGRTNPAPSIEDVAHLADGFVNATPIGMAAHPGLPLSAELIEPRHWVADVVYFPLLTELLRTARAKGCRTLDGSGMVIRQAAEAFTHFTGLPADVGRMEQSFLAEP